MIFRGVYTALVTPFKDGNVDYDAFLKLAKRQVEAGVSGLVLTGTTGEAATLTSDEKFELYGLISREFRGKVQIIAGTGSNSTSVTIESSLNSLKCGVDALLVVAPYYNKPSQEGMFAHFKEVAEKTRAPIILYNVPGRTAANISIETIKRLSKIDNVVAIKEAGTFGQMNDLIPLQNDKFSVLSGDDFTYMPFKALGGSGVISVVSNIVPEKFVELSRALDQNDLPKARALHFEIYPIIEALFVESNPTPCKLMLNKMGLISDEVRLPLVTPTKASREKIYSVLEESKLC